MAMQKNIYIVPMDPICWLIFHILDSVSFVHVFFVFVTATTAATALLLDFITFSSCHGSMRVCRTPNTHYDCGKHTPLVHKKKISHRIRTSDSMKDNTTNGWSLNVTIAFVSIHIIIAVMNSPKICSGVDFWS